MIQKSFGLLFYLKKHHGDANVHRPIYLRNTVDGVMKEMSIHRSWDPARWNTKAGRTIVDRRPFKKAPEQGTSGAEARVLNGYLDTLQAKVHEARHQLLMSGKPVTAEAVRDFIQGREINPERPHMLLEIFQYHNDQVKALVGKEFSKGMMTKFNTVLKHTRAFLQWNFKADDIDIRKLDYEFVTELEFQLIVPLLCQFVE